MVPPDSPGDLNKFYLTLYLTFEKAIKLDKTFAV